jgi:hypothetical protein
VAVLQPKKKAGLCLGRNDTVALNASLSTTLHLLPLNFTVSDFGSTLTSVKMQEIFCISPSSHPS